MNTITQVHQDKHIPIDSLCAALDMPRASYYRHFSLKPAKAQVSCVKLPRNALSDEEKQGVLDLLHSERFIDKTPYQAFNALIDSGEYYCSVRTMYRVLEAEGETQDRRSQRNHRDAVKPELIATKPNEVWSWDVTKLRSDKNGCIIICM